MAFTGSGARLALAAIVANKAATMQLHRPSEEVAGRDSLIHNRLALLELVSEVAEAFQEERITASHATYHTATADGLKKNPRAVLVNRLAGKQPHPLSGR